MSRDREILGAGRIRLFAAALGTALALATAGSAQESQHGNAPSIMITTVPPRGAGEHSWGQIAGKTAGANPEQQRVVLYALTNQWWVQPWADKPFTTLGKDGSFQSGTHLGYTYAALLVDLSFVPQPTLTMLPPVGNGVIAVVQEPGR